jgi:hypothetical protein
MTIVGSQNNKILAIIFVNSLSKNSLNNLMEIWRFSVLSSVAVSLREVETNTNVNVDNSNSNCGST